MYRLLIVDDEPWVLRSLIDSVDWAGNGFALVGTATDGEEALTFMAHLVPDLVVTDILMPVMGGLDLIDHALARWPLTRFIILSGHAEFAYAKRALESGVSGYCLKPVQLEEMTACLARVRTELEEETFRRLEALLSMEEETDAAEAEAILERLGISWDARNGMRVVAGPCRNGIPLMLMEQLFLVQEAQMTELNTAVTTETTIGCSTIIQSAGLLGRAVAEAREARGAHFIDGRSGLRFYRSGVRISLHRQFLTLSNSLSTCDAVGIRCALAQMEQGLLEGEAGLRQVDFCRLRLDAFLETESVENSEDLQNDTDSGIDLIETYPSMHVMFITYGDLLTRQYAAVPQTAETPGGEFVQILMQYVAEHATDRISLMELSEHFHFSPGYLCRLIKRETGRTLTEHQSRLRLDLAAHLLDVSSQTVAKIAQSCGYQDYFYFARLFRKIFGTTPSAYRSRK